MRDCCLWIKGQSRRIMLGLIMMAIEVKDQSRRREGQSLHIGRHGDMLKSCSRVTGVADMYGWKS